LLDLNMREKLVLYPLATLMLVMGIFPNLWLSGIQSETQGTIGWSSRKPFVAPDCVHHKCSVGFATVTVEPIPAGGQQ
jgi:hypothetical protein